MMNNNCITNKNVTGLRYDDLFYNLGKIIFKKYGYCGDRVTTNMLKYINRRSELLSIEKKFLKIN